MAENCNQPIFVHEHGPAWIGESVPATGKCHMIKPMHQYTDVHSITVRLHFLPHDRNAAHNEDIARGPILNGSTLRQRDLLTGHGTTYRHARTLTRPQRPAHWV